MGKRKDKETSCRTYMYKTYTCGACSKGFENDADLFQHLTSRFNQCNSCFYCDPKIRITNDIESHLRIEHSNFHCPDCGDRFFLRSSWKEHVLEHTDLKQPKETFLLSLPGMKKGESLRTFAVRLRRSNQFYERCYKIRDRIQHFMHYNTSYKNSDVFMAGSVGKGTADTLSTDLDLILYLPLNTLDNKSIIDRIKRHVENGDLNWARELMFERITPYSVQFKLSIGDGAQIPVDLLPAAKLLSPDDQNERDKLYRNMKSMERKKRKVYEKGLSHVQVEFVKKVPEALKDVIRIIKFWAKKIRKEEDCKTVRSYFCELVVIDAWREAGSPGQIDIDYFTKLALYRLCFCTGMRIVWPDMYQHHKYIQECDGPMVLDPANPFCNVAPMKRDAFSVSRRAVEILNKEPPAFPEDLCKHSLYNSTVIDMEPFQTRYEREQESTSNESVCCCIIFAFVLVVIIIIILMY